MKPFPWANLALIVITILISLKVPDVREERSQIQERGAPPDFAREVHTVTFSPLVLQRDHFRSYQLVTALFQHDGWLHLFGNMLFLFVFGNAINAKLGHIGFLASYLAIGAIVNLGWIVLGSLPACVGASGAIMGLCGMFLVIYPRNGVTVLWDEAEIALIVRDWNGEVPGWLVVLLYLAFDVWGAITDKEGNVGHGPICSGESWGSGWQSTCFRCAGSRRIEASTRCCNGWPVKSRPEARSVAHADKHERCSGK
jgi:membrane associated rhomboid family serine protease